MGKFSYVRLFRGAAMMSLLIFLAAGFTGPVRNANAQRNAPKDEAAVEKQMRSSKKSGRISRPYRGGRMEGNVDPESGGLDVPHGTDLQVTDLIELPVRNEQGETIGEIEDVMMGGKDTMLAVIAIEGFLGMGEELVTVPVSELKMGENYTHVIYSPPETSDRTGSLRDDQALVGKTVVNRRGEAIGEVENVLAGSQGKSIRAVVSVGGFLGIGDSEVIVSFDDFRMMPGRNFVLYKGTEEALQNEPAYDEPDEPYGYAPRWPYGQPYGYPRAYRYERYETRETPPEYRNRYEPYPYRWENYTMYDELPSYDRYGEEGFHRRRGYWDRRTDSPRQRRMNPRFEEPGSDYDPEPEVKTKSSAVKDRTENTVSGSLRYGASRREVRHREPVSKNE